jgi:SAM-dependent methyltransferase
VAIDPKPANEAGYDAIAERYAAWGRTDAGSVKARYLRRLLDLLPASGARVVDLGCGTGAQVTRHLAERHGVVGVDRSAHSLALARSGLPTVALVRADLGEVAFAPGTVDGVAAFFSIIHLPRDEHGALFTSIHRWLRPGGVVVATLGLADRAEDWGDLLGARLCWSSWDRPTALRLVADAGLEVLSAVDEVEEEDGIPHTHLWVVARRPA